MFLHTFYTWFIANLLHPLMFLLFFFFRDGNFSSLFNVETAEICSLIFVFSLVISLPALLAGWLLLGMIVLSSYTVFARFMLWLICASALVLLSFLLLSLFLDGIIDPKIVSLSVPGIVAVSFSICLRYNHFRQLISSLYTKEQDDTWPEPVKSES